MLTPHQRTPPAWCVPTDLVRADVQVPEETLATMAAVGAAAADKDKRIGQGVKDATRALALQVNENNNNKTR